MVTEKVNSSSLSLMTLTNPKTTATTEREIGRGDQRISTRRKRITEPQYGGDDRGEVKGQDGGEYILKEEGEGR